MNPLDSLRKFKRLCWLHPELKFQSVYAAWRWLNLEARAQGLSRSELLNNTMESYARVIHSIEAKEIASAQKTALELARRAGSSDRIQVLIAPALLAQTDIESLEQQIAELHDQAWLMVLDSTDAIPDGFLGALEEQIDQHSDSLVISFDEWLIEAGKIKPVCKPQWDEDMLWAKPYMGRGLLVRKSVFLEMGGFRFNGEQASLDELLDGWALRWSTIHKVVQTHRLLGWPILRTQSGEVRDSYASQRAEIIGQLLSTHNGLSVSVRPSPHQNLVKLSWPLPEPKPVVTLIVPTRNGLSVLKPCVESILSLTDYPEFELLIMDNQSDCPDTLAFLKTLPEKDSRVRVHQWPHPFNFSAINNAAVALAKGEWVCFVNNDIEPTHPQWLTEMMRLAVRPEVGSVGAKLLYPDGRVQHGGVVLGVGGVAGHSHRFEQADSPGYMQRLQVPQRYSAVTAACMVVQKTHFLAVGGFDEEAFPINYNDVDLCLKLGQKGLKTLWTPDAVLVHHESASRGQGARGLKRWKALQEAKRFKRKWGNAIKTDPAYHPDLTPYREDFSLNPALVSSPRLRFPSQ